MAVQIRVSEFRLENDMKERFRQWAALDTEINVDRRETFIEYAIDAYSLFTGIDDLGFDGLEGGVSQSAWQPL